MNQNNISVKRTGIYSFASTEYEVTYPDGYVGTIWSPPWHGWDDEEEDMEAWAFAKRLFSENKHKKEPILDYSI